MRRIHYWLAIILVAGAVSEIFIYNTYFRKQTTGWNYNDPPNGGFDSVPYYNDGQDGGLILIEGDTFIMGKIDSLGK